MTAPNSSAYLVGLIGSGIATSLTPRLHEQEADALGIRYLYRVLDLDSTAATAADLITATRLTGYDGLNVTHPAKQLVLTHLDQLSPEATVIGAVNTITFTDGRTTGHNTDSTGFTRALTTGLPTAALNTVVLLGAGGAGAAIAHALLSLGVTDLRVIDREPTRATALADRLGTRATAREPADPTVLADADGLVHATPTGMVGHPGLPLPPDRLHPDLWVADIVYRPLTTELLAAARARGCRVLDGGRMAVFQAADTFRLITGREPDADRMLHHFDSLARR
ncbi:shikimate dehydrogenase [Actinophytocola sp.]|uniref:shikimate dehydrogenase n=1 Tax=Actinophytocola sp. TaxID=1872138 RepID=UPI0038999162